MQFRRQPSLLLSKRIVSVHSQLDSGHVRLWVRIICGSIAAMMFYIFQILGQEVCPFNVFEAWKEGNIEGRLSRRSSKQKRRRRRRRRRIDSYRQPPTGSEEKNLQRHQYQSPSKSTNESEVGVKQKMQEVTGEVQNFQF